MICAAVSGSSIVLLGTTECAPTDLVLLTYSELLERTANPFVMSNAAAIQITAAILLVWAVAWVYRRIAATIGTGEPE